MKGSDLIPFHPSYDIIDATKIRTFGACPRRFFFEYILGWSKPSNHLVFGSAWHAAMEHLYTHGMSDKEVSVAHQKLLEVYRPEYGPNTDEIYWPKTPTNALLALAGYVAMWHEDLVKYKVLYTEIGGQVSIGEDALLAFKIDAILEDLRSGKIFGLEHKTASSFYSWDRQWLLDVQPGTYNHVLNCVFPEKASHISINGTCFGKTKRGWDDLYAGKAVSTKTPPFSFMRVDCHQSRDQMATWLWLANYYFDQIKFNMELLWESSDSDDVLMAFPHRPMACNDYGGCPYFDFCTAWSNPLRRCDQVPIGFSQEFWNPLEENLKAVVDGNELKEVRK